MSDFTIQTIYGQRVLADSEQRNTLPANTDKEESESREFIERVQKEKKECLQNS